MEQQENGASSYVMNNPVDGIPRSGRLSGWKLFQPDKSKKQKANKSRFNKS